MRKPPFVVFLTCLCLSVVMLTSSQKNEPVFYGRYIPVFMKRADMENAVKIENKRDLTNPGKIYIHGNYILINEKYKGIHVVDNSDPTNPIFISFIHIDGCIDMAMKDNMLYADNAVDLIAIKLSEDSKSIEVTSRIKNIFPEIQSPDGNWQAYNIDTFRPKDGILVAWKSNNR